MITAVAIDRYTFGEYAIGALTFVLVMVLIAAVGLLARYGWDSRRRAAAAVGRWYDRAMGEPEQPQTFWRW